MTRNPDKVTVEVRLPCPSCNRNLTTEDMVASKYPDGYRRAHQGYNPDGENYAERYPKDGSTMSNTVFFRCTCGANVKWAYSSRIFLKDWVRRY